MTTGEMKHTLVVIGAGASFDCASAAGGANPDWRPPLAKELFAISSRPQFERVLLRFPGAHALSAELAELSQRPTFGLEAKLREYAGHRDERIRRHFQDVPRYLGFLLRNVSANYTQTPGSYVRLIKTLVSDYGHHLVCVILNYDSLFERALRIFDPQWRLESFDDYISADREVRIYKLHGCTRWFIRMTTNAAWAPGSTVQRYLPPSKPPVFELSESISHADESYVPAITPPIAGKTFDDVVCPSSHVESLRQALPQCAKVLFLGTSGLDDNVLSLLSQYLPPAQTVHFVCGADGDEVAHRIQQLVPKTKLRTAEVFTRGFREYVDDEALQRFARI